MKYILYDKKIDQEIDKMIEKLYAHFNPLLLDHFEFSERLALMIRASMGKPYTRHNHEPISCKDNCQTKIHIR